MPRRLENKITLITGAGMGMGREAALLFAREGARVVVADLNGQAAAETVDQVKRAGGEALATVGDVAVEAEVKRMVEEGVRRRRFGEVVRLTVRQGCAASARSTCSTTTRACCGRTGTARCWRPTASSGTA